MRSHGWSRDRTDASKWSNEVSSNDSKFLFVSTGYNFRPMEIQAAIGTLQLEEIDRFVKKRRNIASRVASILEGTSLSVIGSESINNQISFRSNSWMLIPIRVGGDNALLAKQRILERLEELEIETRPVLTGNFLAQPAIQRITRNTVDPNHYQSATQITDTCFLVGAHHDLTEEQIDFLCSSLRSVVDL